MIVDAAIEVIERDGGAGLTMRALGAELDVRAMSVYHHFAGRAELLQAVGDRLFARVNELDLDCGWREACARFAQTLRRVAVERPATFRIVGLEPLAGPGSLRLVERLLGVLVGAGQSPEHALAIYRAVASYARGYALAEAAGFTVDAAGPGGRARLARLERDVFPILAGRIGELARLDTERGFDLGLQGLLNGLAASVPTDS